MLADLLFAMIRTEDVDCIGGMETGAIPLVAALCLPSCSRMTGRSAARHGFLNLLVTSSRRCGLPSGLVSWINGRLKKSFSG